MIFNRGRFNASFDGKWLWCLFFCVLLSQASSHADQIVYNGALQNGWGNWSWATVNLANTSPVSTGNSNSISVSCGGYSALYLANGSLNASAYTSLSFWINGGTGGQSLTVVALTNQTTLGSSYTFVAPTNSWQQIVIPFGALGLTTQTDFDGLWIYNNSSTTLPTFYMDGVLLGTGTNAVIVSSPTISPSNIVSFGSTIAVTASVSGSPPLSYQWQTDGGSGGALANIPGATGPSLSYAPLNTGTFQFDLIVSNSTTSVTSAVAKVTVVPLTIPASINDACLIYTIQLNNGWADNYSYAPYYVTNFSGSNSIACAFTSWQALWFTHNPVNTAIYNNLTFWLNGGPSGGQSINVIGQVGPNFSTAGSTSIVAPANTWQQFTLPLSSLGIANVTNFVGIQFSNPQGGAQSTFYIANMQLGGAPKPAVVHVGVNATNVVRTVSSRIFGINNVAWDGTENGKLNPGTFAQVTNMGIGALRWPGGSWGDGYHWTNENLMSGTDGSTSTRYWGSFTPDFIQTATNAHCQAYIIANYGSGGPAEAAFGVAEMNITNHCNFKYWEIGNEVGGSWELDLNTNAPWQPHDPWTYAMRFAQYYTAMKAVDPTIKIGAVVDTTEDGTANYNNHAAVNPVTGLTHYGWTPVMLYTMRTNNPNALPDFLIDHSYAPGSDGDTENLLWSSTHWQIDAANLRMMLNDYIGYYLGANVASNIELDITEYGPGGNQQSISLVSGLFDADCIGDVMQTEFNGMLRWDLHNGQGDTGTPDNALYGWRTDPGNGLFATDGGVANGAVMPPDPNCYPDYYCMEILKYFARGGDSVLIATNDYGLLSTYAVQRTNGALTMLVINKSSCSNLTAQIKLGGYTPSPSASLYAYGIPQDQAAETGIGSLDVAETNISGISATFSQTFAPYSANVLVLAPAAAVLLPQAAGLAPGRFAFQVQGQSGAPYVVQTCTNLTAPNWISVSTNTPAAGVFYFTNSSASASQFYRAVWSP